MTDASDHDLGMDRGISRRDFLNGVGLTLGSSLLVPGCRQIPASFEENPAFYPPTLTGLRGSHPGSFEVAHQLRDGQSWDHLGSDADTGESYDLVVVGGGLSGLSAAYFFQKSAGRGARVLILDNHDDFGGHAKRNEFQYNGRLLLMNGGTLNIEGPSQYSPEAMALLKEIGVDTARYYEAAVPAADHYRSLNLNPGIFFDRETFGEDRLVLGSGQLPWPEFLDRTPLSDRARKDIARLYEAHTDYMPGLSSSEKKKRLARMSYRDFLLQAARVHPDVLPFFQNRTHGNFCLGIDAVPALYCWEMGEVPGFQGMALDPTPPENLIGEPGGQHGRENEARLGSGDPDIYLPDGNATIARLLVRALIPEAVPGHSMEDVITARLDYGRLDNSGSANRIRLNSTVVRARHLGDPATANQAEVTYVRGGKAYKVRCAACVMACWNTVIPYLCPELPEQQKAALAYGTKAPIVYTSVLLRDWTSFQKLGVSDIHAPGGYHSSLYLSLRANLGEYRDAHSPQQPVVVRMVRTPCAPGLSKKEQHRAGRHDLFSTTFETFERQIRDQLGRMLSQGGFDPAQDIEAITVNRWPHGYTYTYNTLYDPVEWALATPDDRPCVVGRKRFGLISIANADSEASSHTDAAIDAAHRAIQEILNLHRDPKRV